LPPRPPASRPAPLSATPAAPPLNALIRVLTGAAAGREVALVKVVTTLGKPGSAVASITRRHHGFVLAHVEGSQPPLLNGESLAAASVPLKSGDRVEVAGTAMEFVQV
ncbi:MAG: FHA domain-containing protein, partial [Comamonadaceae bacterium]